MTVLLRLLDWHGMMPNDDDNYDEWEIAVLALPRVGDYLYYGGPDDDNPTGVYTEEWAGRVTRVQHHIRDGSDKKRAYYLPFIVVTAVRVCTYCYSAEHQHEACPDYPPTSVGAVEAT